MRKAELEKTPGITNKLYIVWRTLSDFVQIREINTENNVKLITFPDGDFYVCCCCMFPELNFKMKHLHEKNYFSFLSVFVFASDGILLSLISLEIKRFYNAT
jgi:hypothetical protein